MREFICKKLKVFFVNKLFVVLFFLFLVSLFGCVEHPNSTYIVVTYTNESAWKNYSEIIQIKAYSGQVRPEGDFNYTKFDGELDSGVGSEQSYLKLSAEEMDSFYDFVLNENRFFSIPENLDNTDCMDGSTSYITVTIHGKTRKVGGYCVDNQNYINIVNRLYQLQTRAEIVKEVTLKEIVSSVDDFPKFDGSTTTEPLSVLIATRALDTNYEWHAVWNDSTKMEEMRILPLAFDEQNEEESSRFKLC
jgi:hypothetical protein